MFCKEEDRCVYRDRNADVEERVKDLISRMSLEEKVGQMTQIERSVAALDPSIIGRLCIGSILSGGGSGPPQPSNSNSNKASAAATAVDWADMVDAFQKSALNSRLGIPILYATDAVHGHNNVFGATIFPHNIALGATRDEDLITRIGAATALEVRATGIHCTFAPCVAVCRDPRWGRCFECYSEDTDIVRNMASIVSGLQGLPPEGHPKGYPFVAGRRNVIACAKHFVGDGGTERGINEGDTMSSLDNLEMIHMRPYLDCLAQGVCTVMASYSSWNGSKLHSDHFLLTNILKEKLNFKGFVISDWEGIDGLCHPHGSDYRYCIAASINAGIDMVMVPFRYEKFLEDVIYLVKKGVIPMSRIHDAVERILRVKFIAELFEYPMSDSSLLDTVGCKIHRELAREAVRKSLVLLKNGKDSMNRILPLDKNARRILISGSHADDIGNQCGGWTITWHGGSGRITIGTTILEAIKATVGENTDVVYEECPSLDAISRGNFSYAVVAIGEHPYAESLGDNNELEIPLSSKRLIDMIAGIVPTLVVLISGRPLVVEPKLLEKMDALVAAWLPGTQGEGITDVLFGEYDFHGVLPRTWFRSVDQLPVIVGDESYDPLFPFGYGLKLNMDNSCDGGHDL